MSQTSTPRQTLLKGQERAVGKSNMKVDFDSLPCHPTCQIIVEILRRHFVRHLLTESCDVPEVYMTQFWESFKASKNHKTITLQLDKSTINLSINTLRLILKLPQVKKFAPFPSLEDVIAFHRELGYDESTEELTKISKIDRKFIPQPWLTLYSILTNCIG